MAGNVIGLSTSTQTISLISHESRRPFNIQMKMVGNVK